MHRRVVVGGTDTRQGSNDEFEGFIPDLLVRLSQRAGVNYQIKQVSDGKYGSPGPDGSWNGMIGELVRGVC